MPYLFNSLTYLCEQLSNNLLVNLPESISQLTALKKLNVLQNQFTEIPPVYMQLTFLESLDLSDGWAARVSASLPGVSNPMP